LTDEKSPEIGARKLADVTIVDTETALHKIKTASAERGDVTVWYFGLRYDTYLHLLQNSPTNHRFPALGEALNEAAWRIADTVHNFDSQAVSKGLSALWDASDLGETNPLKSEFHLDCSRAVILMEASAKGGCHLVVVDDQALGRFLFSALRRNGYAAKQRLAGGRTRPGLLFNALLKRFFDTRQTLKNMALLRRLRRGRPHPLTVARGADVLLTTWARADSFPSSKSLELDAYFGNFPALLQSLGLKVAYLANPMDWVEPFEPIARNAVAARDPVILPHDCLSALGAVRMALATLIFSPRIRKHLRVGSFDLSDLVRLALARELGSRQAWAMCFRGIGKALERGGVRPRFLFHLYENQPWEKCLRAGFRAHLPETKLIAAQHSSFPELYMSFYPTRREIESGCLPDLLLTIGDEYNKRFKKFAYPAERIVAGGALRYADFFSKAASSSDAAPRASNTDPKAVLCCTGITYDSALELVYRTLEATSELADLRIVVNFHPVTAGEFRDRLKADVSRFLKAGFRLPEYSAKSVQELLSEVDVVVYNVSGAALEGLAMGVPAVFIGSEIGIDYDTVADETLTRQSRSRAQVRRAIVESLDEGRLVGTRKIEIQKRLHRHIGGVNESVWRNIVSG